MSSERKRLRDPTAVETLSSGLGPRPRAHHADAGGSFTDARKASRSVLKPRILATLVKRNHPLWVGRTVVLPGWLEAWDQMPAKPKIPWRDVLYWGWKLFRASREFDAVVTANERIAHAFALLQRLARRRKVPHVFVECGWELPGSPWRRALRHLQYTLEMGATSRIVLYTRHQVERYVKAYGLPVEKFVCVPFHTTLYGFRCPVSEGNYVFAGGDHTRDYGTLIEAAKALPSRVVIAALLRDYFQGLDIPPNVQILTASREQFFRLMAGAGVVAVPLRGGLLHSGGQQTYLNAMLMGKPVVVADDCGADEYITHGVTGMLVKPGDSVGLREAIRTVLEDRSFARSLGRNAKLAAAEYSPERFFERVFALVDDCIDREK